MEYKIFNDSIHGHIELHPLCVAIIDTPEFQRLRALRQLGGCYWVYPGAANNRFEHSLGVCYLAGQMARQLKTRQPELGITDIDVLCVEIAGLCHDLGHGPFSHLFDRLFLPAVDPETTWTHELGSITMIRFMLSQHADLKALFLENGLDDMNITFIQELIAGPICCITSISKKFDKDGGDSNVTAEVHHNKRFKGKRLQECPHHMLGAWKYQGRGREKSFLYEIVANHKTGVDVDKWDYFARDCHHLGLKNNFDYARLLKFNRVIRDEDGLLTICYKDKEAKNLYDMFNLRDSLHRKAYQHTVATIIELMIRDALVLANDHLLFTGSNNKKFRMSEAIWDMRAYLKVTDFVYYQILYSEAPELQASKRILQRIENRHLYKYIGRVNFSSQESTKILLENIKIELIGIINDNETSKLYTANDLVLQIVDFDYGMEEKDPMENVRFFTKDRLSEAKKIRKSEISNMLPETFAERYLRIYSRLIDPDFLSRAKAAFTLWCSQQSLLNISHNAVSVKNNHQLTPIKYGNNSLNNSQGSTLSDTSSNHSQISLVPLACAENNFLMDNNNNFIIDNIDNNFSGSNDSSNMTFRKPNASNLFNGI